MAWFSHVNATPWHRARTHAVKLICSFCAVGFLLSTARADVLASGWVPSSFMPQGQVQLVSDDDGLQVRVLLHSRFMDRVVQSIIEKESANWPADDENAVTYIRLLREARQTVHKKSGGKGRESLIVTFVLNPKPGNVAWSTGNIDKNKKTGSLSVSNATVIAGFQPSRDYLIRNAALIIEDSIGMKRKDVRSLLAEHLDGDDLEILKGMSDDH